MTARFDKPIYVVGGGLAGTECALQLADLGYKVVLIEMRGSTMTPAHKTGDFAELVCSNSFGSKSLESAPGQLKWEAGQLRSHILSAATQAEVPAGQALGVDRAVLSQVLNTRVRNHSNIRVEERVVQSLDDVPRPAVIATGPLTHESLARSLQQHFGHEFLYFFDAIAPIIDADSINEEIAWRADRYGKGSADYLNCPLNEEQYFAFIQEIKNARKVEAKDFEKDTPYFEGCMPVEVMAERGDLTLAFGPMKPVGLPDPRTGKETFAVVQLRQENREGTAWNMVGFQTKMAYGEQTRVFRMIPGLENAEFLKLGSIHRNLFIHTPKMLNKDLSSPKDPYLFFAGQITGVEGYFESTSMGLLVSQFIHQKLSDRPFNPPPRESALGSLWRAITDPKEDFQPTNINFGLFPDIRLEGGRKMKKTDKRAVQLAGARAALLEYRKTLNLDSI